MLPFFIILANMGFFGTENAPEYPSMSSTPRALNNPIYSVHNYKRPYAGLMERNKKGINVNSLAGGSTSYKRQRPAEPSVGGLSFVYKPTTTSVARNYKQQNQPKPVEATAKSQPSGNLVSVLQNAPDSLRQEKQN